MRAIVCTDYGPPEVLRLTETAKPAPKDNEVLIRIRATTVSQADCELRRFDFPLWVWVPIRLTFGITRPRQPVLGQELAGEIESVGADVTSFAQGDRVFAATGIGLGAYAEYICLRESPQTGAIATMPANLSYEEAAAVPYGGGEALEFLRKGNVRAGQRVLVNGAGGSFGTFAVQLAKIMGAHVTAVDSAPKLEMLRAIGADRVIDYSQEDFTNGPETYDVIFDVVRHTPSARMVRSLNENGCLLMANPGFLQIVRAKWAARGSEKRVLFAASSGTAEDLAYLRGLIEAGELRPVIDRTLPAGADGRGSPVRRDRAEVGEHRRDGCLVGTDKRRRHIGERSLARKKRTYNVYVIELSRDVLEHRKFVDANPYMRRDKPCVYVGSTYLTPEARYQQHLKGYRSNRYVREYAIELKPRLYTNWQGYETRKLAEAAEVKRAESLRKRGYAVWYGV